MFSAYWETPKDTTVVQGNQTEPSGCCEGFESDWGLLDEVLQLADASNFNLDAIASLQIAGNA